MTDPHMEKKINHARIAAMVSGTLTLTGSLSIIWNQTRSQLSLLNIMALVDAIFIFGMAYGIYKKSRICAVLMFEYFLLSKIFSASVSPHINPASLMIGMIFLYFFFRGITGTFDYHKCKTCREGTEALNPFTWILAGSGGLIVYVLVLPHLLV